MLYGLALVDVTGIPCGSGVVKQVAATLEPVAELRNSPRRNDLDLPVAGKESQC